MVRGVVAVCCLVTWIETKGVIKESTPWRNQSKITKTQEIHQLGHTIRQPRIHCIVVCTFVVFHVIVYQDCFFKQTFVLHGLELVIAGLLHFWPEVIFQDY